MANIAYDQINAFFIENIDKFILIFKIEYIKLVYDNLSENRMVAVKNPHREKKSPELKKQISSKKTEEFKSTEDPQAKPEENKGEENPTKTNQIPSKAEPKDMDIAEIKEIYSNLAFFFPEIVNLNANMLNLNKLTLYLPIEKSSGMLDLLNWSMNACYQEYIFITSSILESNISFIMSSKDLLHYQ